MHMHEAAAGGGDYATLEAALSFLSECGDDDDAGGDAAAWRLLHSDAHGDDVDLELDESLHAQPARDDPDELLTLSALLAAEHLPSGHAPDYKPLHNPGMMMAMMSAGFPTVDFNPQSLLLAGGGSSSSSSSAGSSPVARPAGGGGKRSSSSSASTALARKRPSKKKPAGYNSNRARDERKEELIYLRKTVAEMETRLDKLKQHAPVAGALPAPPAPAAAETTVAAFSPASSSSSTGSSSSSSGDVAMMTAAEAQSRAAAQQLSNSALEKILKKRTSLRILESVRGTGKRVKCMHHPGESDAAIFEELLAGVDKTLEEVDSVFEANGLGRMQTAYRDAQLRHDETSGMVMEIFANKVMPFDVRATAAAVWRHYGHSIEHMPTRSHYQKQIPHIKATDDMIVESYGLELHGSRTKGNFLCKQIMRRFEQPERIVIGWRAQAEALDLSAETTAGIRLVERGSLHRHREQHEDVVVAAADDSDDDDTLQLALAFMDAFEAPGAAADAADAVAPLTESDCEWMADVPSDTMQLVVESARSATDLGARKQPLVARKSGAKVKVPGSTNKARDSRKEELIYLRRKVAELEQLLTACKQRQPAAICAARAPKSAPPTRRPLSLASTEEPSKTTSTKDFDKFVHSEQRVRWTLDAAPVPSQDANARLFDELLGGLDQSYLETEAVFEANGLARLPGNTRIDAVVRPDERSGILVEVFASKALPFDLRAAGAVVWNHYAFAKERLPNRAYRHNAPQDFNLEIDLNDAIALYRVRLVMRRFTEETRVVIVWRAFADTLQIADERTDGARFLERGYIVIRAAAAAGGGASAGAAADAAACAASDDDDERLLLALLEDPEALDLDLDLLPLSGDDALASPARASSTAVAGEKRSGDDDDPGALITKAVAAAIARRRRSGASSARKRQPPKLKAAASATKLLKYNTNKARDERREELLYLRRKVAELETRLTDMRVGAPPVPALQQQPQQQQRSRGQATAVVRKAGVLEKLLRKTASAKEVDRYTRSARVHYVGPPPSHHKDAELFGLLLADVAALYAEVDDVFAAVGLARLEPPRIDARVQQRRSAAASGAHHVELQVFGCKVLPFDTHAAGLAVWNHYVFAKERTPNRFYCHQPAPGGGGQARDSSSSAEEDTVLENFNMEVDVNGTTVLYCMKLVLRRYIEPERVVVVWRAFFDPTHVSDEPLSGVRFLEKGYVVVAKMAADSDAGNGDSRNIWQFYESASGV
ncbi:hypothetical protein PybrP1_011596 [[Pythium] brassicae (nom. inval.)]|nr:hypothetical protein PybrP1_011596 [[Pythium] brassicae (nom. inval.)]